MLSSHTMIVGGTGMLSGCVSALLAQGRVVSTLSRRSSTSGALAVHADYKKVSDYTESSALLRALDEATEALGPVEHVIAWVHGSASDPDALLTIVRHLRPARLTHVLGSASAAPDALNPARRLAFEALGCAYQEVILGFVLGAGEPPGARWLTHAEIVAGVLDALASGATRAVVGQVRPWSARP